MKKAARIAMVRRMDMPAPLGGLRGAWNEMWRDLGCSHFPAGPLIDEEQMPGDPSPDEQQQQGLPSVFWKTFLNFND
jgi:hypothetical protein